VSLANTGEPLYLVNRSGNRPSGEGAAERFDQAAALCRRAGFGQILFRGDTDFTQTGELDRWDAQGDVQFIFGLDAIPTLVKRADALPKTAWKTLVRAPQYDPAGPARARPANAKEEMIRVREFKNIRLVSESVAQFEYRPGKCGQPYRVVVVRKNLSVEKGEQPRRAGVRRPAVLLLHHQRSGVPVGNDRAGSQWAVPAGEPDRATQERGAGAGDAGRPR
jgi:hypothetical protein